MTTNSERLGEHGRLNELEPLAVVDIGSNSVRLVVYEGAVRAPAPIYNEKVLCGLGRAVATSGRLGEESVERALNALARFSLIARILEVKNLRVIATAAVREAVDGADFIRRGEKAVGTRIEVLSGETEAALAAHGIMMGFGNVEGIAGDLGGGSLELITIDGAKLKEAVTLPLGGLRLIDSTSANIERAVALVDEALAGVPWIAGRADRPFYAVGGTWRSLARLHMDRTSYPLRVMQGYEIAGREAAIFCESIRKARKIGNIEGIESVNRQRREILPYGALVLERLLKRLAPSRVVFSVFGIREGLLFSQLSAFERAKDPLLCFCEDIARLRSRSLTHAQELCRWTDALFAEPGPKERDDERRLRHAACLLSDVAWRGHPDYRGEQSLNLIAHASLGGTDHAGRVFLALTVHYRHLGTSDSSDPLSVRLRELVTKRMQRRARIVGLAVRAAHMLSIGQPGVITETPIGYEGGRLVLSIPQDFAHLDGERVRARFKALGEIMERGIDIRVAGR